jgi:arylsulfatase A-like enzyme
MDHLEEKGLLDNTMIIFSSDNGPVLNDGYFDEAVEKRADHKQAGPLRGGKYSLFEGGARVPFIVHWPAQVKPCVSDAVVCHTDFYASFASMLGLDMKEEEALDSENMLDALKGLDTTGRQQLVTEGIMHNTILREGDWVYIPPYEGEVVNPFTQTDMGKSDTDQLYCLSNDIGQMQNLGHVELERVKSMAKSLEEVMASKKTRAS